ncbi:DNA cytosine methyltransferase [Streptomyces omiyaensis]|uniref:DNA (cytosine-5-)-methyltransferase n=1 Tax=Streptomyces omiyaensis TaxID=68247 RepID=A0ABW7BLW3_9ACTN
MAARDLGYEVTGIEFDADACETRTEAKLATLQGDVRDFGPHKFPNATVLAGGPPCQTFTVAGGGAGRRALDEVIEFVQRMAQGEDVRSKLAVLDDERTGLVLEPLRWALEAIKDGRPYEAIVLEQVPAVLPVWYEYRKVLLSQGYSVPEPKVLHTEQYGVPQTRRRAILVARLNAAATLPDPTHRLYRKGVPRNQGDPAHDPWVPMSAVLGRSTAFEVISNYGTGGDPKSRGRRTSEEPAFTVTGKVSRNRVVDMDGNELPRFTESEAGLLQTFPGDYPWSGRAVAQQIGNAIPPLLGKAVLNAVVGPADRYAAG